jgi:hypothetical protein
MVQRRQRLRFTPEAGKPLGIVREGGGKYLQRDVAIELRVTGPIDLAHATGANPAADVVHAEMGPWGKRHLAGHGPIMVGLAARGR